VEHIAAEPQKEIAFWKKVLRLGQILEAPGNKFFSTTYRDFVLPEARCLSKFVTKAVNNYSLQHFVKFIQSLIFRDSGLWLG